MNPEMQVTTPAGEHIIATPENASLFTHIGEAALYDHVFIVDDEKESGLYIFKFNRGFEQVQEYMIENGYPLHLNQRDVAECDRKTYDHEVDRMTREADNWTVPDEWAA